MVRRLLLLGLVLTTAAGCSPRNPLQDGGEEEPRSPIDENGWPSVLPEYDDYEGTGAQVGDKLWDFTEVDQCGAEARFAQLLGHVIVLDVSSVWCGPCNEAAAESAHTWELMQEIGPSYFVTLLAQNQVGGQAAVSDARMWADSYDIEYPVFIDGDEANRTRWGIQNFPVFFFIAPDGTIFDRLEIKPDEGEILDAVTHAVEEWSDLLRPYDEDTPLGHGCAEESR